MVCSDILKCPPNVIYKSNHMIVCSVVREEVYIASSNVIVGIPVAHQNGQIVTCAPLLHLRYIKDIK